VKQILSQKTLAFGIVILFSFGFRLNRGFKWDVDVDDPTVWLDVDQEIMNSTFDKTEFTDNATILEGVADADQVRAIMQAIIADYNGITTSFIRLALPDAPAAEDSDISTFDQSDRRIRIAFGTPPALGATGYASTTGEGRQMTGCTIILSDTVLASAKAFKHTLTHELGHCFDLDHTHSDRDSIMSYNAGKIHALGVDDKIALTYLYPTDDDYAKEVATLGLACARQK
jgi:predicted Zn-dependent protease